MNLSQQRREESIKRIKEIRDFIAHSAQDENAGRLLTYLSELEKEIKGKKYGLVFEEHREKIDETLENNLPVLTELEDLYIDNGGQMNFLIEGDNLAALQLLLKTHRGKIDLIYIDPPYNTGNKDFIYDDNYVDIDDGFRHSKWSSFMEKRLALAKELLAKTGVIFIQISDIELAQLRILCDTIFGEENFLNVISVNMKNIAGASGGGEDKRFKKNCEYILVYAKYYPTFPLFKNAYDFEEIYSLIERYKAEGVSWKYNSVLVYEGDKEYIASTEDGDGNEIRIYLRKNYIIRSIKKLALDEGISEKEVFYKYGRRIFQTALPQSSIRPRIMTKLQELHIENDFCSIEYVPRSGRNRGILYEQFYKGDACRLLAWLSDVSEIIDGVLYKKTLQGTYWNYAASTKNLSKEGNVDFGNGKKPLDLLKRIVNLVDNNNGTVLDFFAGSGTTGHAVISLNAEDGGTRRFILCTNNENNICSNKTYPRLKNVINGYTTDNGKSFPPNAASLKYFKIDFVRISERLYYEYDDELLLHIRELVELENGVNFRNNSEIAIVLTDEELDAFMENRSALKACKALYVGHDVLINGRQSAALKRRKIAVNVIPQYYYEES